MRLLDLFCGERKIDQLKPLQGKIDQMINSKPAQGQIGWMEVAFWSNDDERPNLG